MNIPAKSRYACALLGVVGFGLATALVFLIPTSSPSSGLPSDAQSAKLSVNVLAKVPSVALVREAKAVAVALPNETTALHVVGGDSRFDNYQLERDSCCIGN